MAGGEDRLSHLPDDLLRRVLHFAPLKEAASTTALSRRWRAPLWLSSGAVNLKTGQSRLYHNLRFFTGRDDLVSAAVAALEAADVPVTRLSLRLDSDLHEPAVGHVMTPYSEKVDKIVSRYTDLVDVVLSLSHRAGRHVEELRLVAKDTGYYLSAPDRKGLYTVTLDYLSLENLRVLELTHCKGLLYQSVFQFQQLSSLRLHDCVQRLSSLQRVIDAAPALTYVRLESVLIDTTDDNHDAPPQPSQRPIRRHLRCPAATVLVLDSCTWEEENRCHQPYVYYSKKTIDVDSVEIDAERLRRFRYKGPLRSFSFSPQPLELEKVDLDFFGKVHNRNNNKDPDRDFATFWRFAGSFASTKEMRLRVNHLDEIAVLGKARRVELLPAFRRIERLEVQGAHSTKGKDAALAILNLLRCCPMLTALRINLTAEIQKDASDKKGKEIQIAALLGPRHLYQCLQSSLRRVGLKFQLEKWDCLGVKLIKFFAENAMVLEEIHIDGGDEKLCEDMIPKTEKWNSKRRKLGATSFVVLPLKR